MDRGLCTCVTGLCTCATGLCTCATGLCTCATGLCTCATGLCTCATGIVSRLFGVFKQYVCYKKHVVIAWIEIWSIYWPLRRIPVSTIDEFVLLWPDIREIIGEDATPDKTDVHRCNQQVNSWPINRSLEIVNSWLEQRQPDHSRVGPASNTRKFRRLIRNEKSLAGQPRRSYSSFLRRRVSDIGRESSGHVCCNLCDGRLGGWDGGKDWLLTRGAQSLRE